MWSRRIMLLVVMTLSLVWASGTGGYSAIPPGPEKVTNIRVYAPVSGGVDLAWTTASGGFSVTMPEGRAFFIAEQIAAGRTVWTEVSGGIRRFYVDMK